MPRFRPRALPTIGVALGAVVFGGLGTWQLRRMGEAAEARVTWAARLAEPPFDAAAPPADPDVRRVRLTGTPDWNRHLLLPNKVRGSLPGFELVVPVHGAGPVVLVNVGWVPGDAVDAVVARERALGPRRTYEGLARVYAEEPDAGEGFPAEPDGFRRYWRVISPDAMGQGVDVAPFVVVEGAALPERGDGPDSEPPIGGWRATPHERPHGEYALTWFAILATLIGLWVHGSTRPDPSGESAGRGP